MIQFEEAYNIAINKAKKLKSEKIKLVDATNRVLAEDVFSDMDMPPFNKSAVDGFACKKSDITKNLEVLEIIAAGQLPTLSVGNNQCSKIMTGAKVPDGADCVIMVEDSEYLSENTIRFKKEFTAPNFSKQYHLF